jgi:Spy/CpxP family protein refolding chaperone
MNTNLIALLLSLLLTSSVDAESSPYAGEQRRDIKALSPQEIDDLLAGNGMGFAKAAELNGLPGPKHVLQLAEQLGLDAGQRERTQSLFDRMQKQARALGAELVAHERALDEQFARQGITREQLHAALARIGELRTALRGVHLEAHLDEAALLTPEQITRYAALRGYSGHQHTME